MLICGTRDFNDFGLLQRKMDHYTKDFLGCVIITGGSRTKVFIPRIGPAYVGADELGKRWAIKRWHTVWEFFPDWEKHGKAAGPIRNSEMLEALGKDGYLVAFWDGRSPGTKDMIRKARRVLKPSHIKVVRYD